jgi:lysozyme
MKTVNIETIKSHEALRLKAYMPTPNDVTTIGNGHTKGVKLGQVITKEQAEVFLREDLKVAEDTVNKLVKVKITQNQFDALVSLVFNIGTGNFANSSVLKFLNAGNYKAAADRFRLWNKQKQKDGSFKELGGLTKRREQERELFLK